MGQEFDALDKAAEKFKGSFSGINASSLLVYAEDPVGYHKKKYTQEQRERDAKRKRIRQIKNKIVLAATFITMIVGTILYVMGVI